MIAWNPFGIVYGDLIESLRHELTARADEPTPVFGFGYDWRQDCARSAAQLGPFIEEVLARTALLRHYNRLQISNPGAYPVVRLKPSGYQDNRFGWVNTPSFIPVGIAAGMSADVPDTSLKAQLNDAIGF